MRRRWRHHPHLKYPPCLDQIAFGCRGLPSDTEKNQHRGRARTLIAQSESSAPSRPRQTTKNRQPSAERLEPNSDDRCGGPKIVSCCRTCPPTSLRICRRPRGNAEVASSKLHRFWSPLQFRQAQREPL